jgi:hypothetical protein
LDDGSSLWILVGSHEDSAHLLHLDIIRGVHEL